MPNLLLLKLLTNYHIHKQVRLCHTSCLCYRSIPHWFFQARWWISATTLVSALPVVPSGGTWGVALASGRLAFFTYSLSA
jgi:hypothetical protein